MWEEREGGAIVEGTEDNPLRSPVLCSGTVLMGTLIERRTV
jgi:hypothetical protein